MKQFLSLVPRMVRRGAAAIVCFAVLVGPVVGWTEATVGSHGAHGPGFPVLLALAGLGIGLMISGFFAAWLLGLGYVYADAQRRAMPPALWALLAAVVPNLLGFLLYVAIRRPMARPCVHCGQPIVEDQRFCPWCGTQALTAPGGGFAPTAAA
jgi:hypothetical protein